MPKQILLFLLVLGLSATSIIAQDDALDQLDLEFESSPLEEQSVPYFAIGGGFSGTYFLPAIDELNNHLIDQNFLDGKGLPSNFFMWGGEGFTAIGLIANVRIGIISTGGSAFEEYAGNDANDLPFTRKVDYHIGMTGLAIDYAIVPFKKFAIMTGAVFSLGSAKITNSQAYDAVNWSDFEPAPDDLNYMESFESDFIGIQPRLNIEYALNQFIMFRAGVSYNLTLMGDWTYNGLSKVGDVKSGTGAGLQDIDGSGLGVNFGVFIGLFNY